MALPAFIGFRKGYTGAISPGPSRKAFTGNRDMNILLTGASGQLGTELIPLLSGKGQLYVTDRSPPAHQVSNWMPLDVTDRVAVGQMLNDVQPGLVVNAAAYTAVDQAETEPDTSFAVNAEFPGQLAHWAKQHDALLIHYSTDYVFDGKGSSPYKESQTAAPQNVYGESKLGGEHAILSSGCRHSILRTSWVYSSHGKNFVLSMLNLARKGIALNVVDDQRGCPTWAGSLARASDLLIGQWQTDARKDFNGLFHYCDDRSLSWYEFATAIFKQAVTKGLLDLMPALAPIPSSEFPQPATRPQWSVLNTEKIQRVFNLKCGSFDQSLKTVVDEISRERNL